MSQLFGNKIMPQFVTNITISKHTVSSYAATWARTYVKFLERRSRHDANSSSLERVEFPSNGNTNIFAY